MSIEATVIIPTWNHGRLLLHSVRSALTQTVADLEVFIIGDGITDEGRAAVDVLMKQDARVRFFDHPKSPRNGELYRHAALQEARGKIVCYLSDDDLWLPEHVETMRANLAGADFTHAFPARIEPDGAINACTTDLGLAYFKEEMLSGRASRINLSSGAHTLEMYRKLPHGWRTTPKGVYSDLYMWQQFAAHPGCRFVSGDLPTVVNIPSPPRRDWPLDRRAAELKDWEDRVSTPEGRRRFFEQVFKGIKRNWSQAEAALSQELLNMKASTAWRLRQWLANIPFLRSAYRMISGKRGRTACSTKAP